MSPAKAFIRKIPVVGDLARSIYRTLSPADSEPEFRNSSDYWETRYRNGGNSGVGSYGKLAEFKAGILNEFVRDHGVETVFEFGCGDGNQVSLSRYPRYTGYDVSPKAVALCRKRFAADPTRTFHAIGDYAGETADLALSLDVIYHLVEDAVFEAYMRTLFQASRRFVIVYSSDTTDNEGFAGTHVWHRKFTGWVEANLPEWRLIRHIPNRYPFQGDYTQGSFADFFIFELK